MICPLLALFINIFIFKEDILRANEQFPAGFSLVKEDAARSISDARQSYFWKISFEKKDQPRISSNIVAMTTIHTKKLEPFLIKAIHLLSYWHCNYKNLVFS
jgi:hypothetical protein